MSTYLEERLEWYDHNYRMGTPLITDAQFDKLEANLFRVDPEANYFSKKTILPLPSLAKNETEEFLNVLLPDTRLIIEPKVDGCAIAIQYIDGELVKAITRKGGDVTNKIKDIPDVPSKINIKGLIQIRGELYASAEYERPAIAKDRQAVILRLLLVKVIISAFVLFR